MHRKLFQPNGYITKPFSGINAEICSTSVRKRFFPTPMGVIDTVYISFWKIRYIANIWKPTCCELGHKWVGLSKSENSLWIVPWRFQKVKDCRAFLKEACYDKNAISVTQSILLRQWVCTVVDDGLFAESYEVRHIRIFKWIKRKTSSRNSWSSIWALCISSQLVFDLCFYSYFEGFPSHPVYDNFTRIQIWSWAFLSLPSVLWLTATSLAHSRRADDVSQGRLETSFVSIPTFLGISLMIPLLLSSALFAFQVRS